MFIFLNEIQRNLTIGGGLSGKQPHLNCKYAFYFHWQKEGELWSQPLEGRASFSYCVIYFWPSQRNSET